MCVGGGREGEGEGGNLGGTKGKGDSKYIIPWSVTFVIKRM